MTEAMRRAVTELVGIIDPTAFGLSIQPLKKRSSSSNLVASDFRKPRAIFPSPPFRRVTIYATSELKQGEKRGHCNSTVQQTCITLRTIRRNPSFA